MAELRHVIKNPIVLSAVAATGGYGGLQDGYDVVFVEDGQTVWIEKTAFEEAFGSVTEAEDITFPSALAVLQEGIEVSRETWGDFGKLIEFKRPDRFNYVNDDEETVQVQDKRGIGFANGNQIPETRWNHIDCYVATKNDTRRKVWNATSKDMTANDWKVVE